MQILYTDTKLKEYNEREERFRLAVEEATNNKTASINSIANKYKVSRTTLSRRIHGFKNTRNSHEKQQKFTNSEETQIVDNILALLSRHPKDIPQKREILGVCEDLLKIKYKDENLDPESNIFKVGKNWIDRFLERHNDKLKLSTGVSLSEFYKNEFLQKKKMKTSYNDSPTFQQPSNVRTSQSNNPLQYQQVQQSVNMYGQPQNQQQQQNYNSTPAKTDPFLYPSEQQPGQLQSQQLQPSQTNGSVESSVHSTPSERNPQQYNTPRSHHDHQEQQVHPSINNNQYSQSQQVQPSAQYNYYNNGNMNSVYRSQSTAYPSYAPPPPPQIQPPIQQQTNYQYNQNQLYDRYNNISQQNFGSFSFPGYTNPTQQMGQQQQSPQQLTPLPSSNPSTSSISEPNKSTENYSSLKQQIQPYQPTQYDLLRYYQNNKFQYDRIQQDILRKLNDDQGNLEACKLINFAFEQFERDLNWNNGY